MNVIGQLCEFDTEPRGVSFSSATVLWTVLVSQRFGFSGCGCCDGVGFSGSVVPSARIRRGLSLRYPLAIPVTRLARGVGAAGQVEKSRPGDQSAGDLIEDSPALHRIGGPRSDGV